MINLMPSIETHSGTVVVDVIVSIPEPVYLIWAKRDHRLRAMKHGTQDGNLIPSDTSKF